MFAYHFILHTQVAPISASPLPATLCPLHLHTHIYMYMYYIYIYILTSPTHSLAPEPPPPFLLTDQKGTTPQTYVFYFQFLPPVSVAVTSISPHEINLCPMLPHHFLLHAKSLPGPALRAPPKPEAGFRPLPSQVYVIMFCSLENFSKGLHGEDGKENVLL